MRPDRRFAAHFRGLHLVQGGSQICNGQFRARDGLRPDAQLGHLAAPDELVNNVRDDQHRNPGAEAGGSRAEAVVMNQSAGATQCT
uniref:Uncharacterized protein n=1 Tax=Caldilinea aerophila TaxID=133453 RepID=A0A7C1FJ21_9CHLR